MRTGKDAHCCHQACDRRALRCCSNTAAAVALSPFPLIGVVLILTGDRAERNGALFAGGWIAGLAIVATAVVTLFSGAYDPDSTSSAIADCGRVVVGAGLIVLGVRTWLSRPREGDEAQEPGWMTSLDLASARRALVLGPLLSGTNPKNFVLTASAASSIAEAGKQGEAKGEAEGAGRTHPRSSVGPGRLRGEVGGCGRVPLRPVAVAGNARGARLARVRVPGPSGLAPPGAVDRVDRDDQ
ncbi:GAP family protein [Kitasatospora sp. NBC_01302]|uniref:GAP family protein n=1 Tax=Kitasatospora sp. NBC_01302 TaxID=2903575 RepID=UPI002E14DBB9|nr:GAP family protein [Kitasatospora sp. NBC_01302]